MTPTTLLHHANRALFDAAKWARDPNGAGLAALRRRDAEYLRRMAREMER
jgi:hypothetical protein